MSVAAVSAQDIDLFPDRNSPRSEPPPKSMRERLQKLRIEKEKKEYQEMLDRGDTVLKLSDQLEKSVTASGLLSQNDMSRLSEIEDLVKEIRGDMGGKNANDDDREDKDGDTPKTLLEKISALRSRTQNLVEQMKSTSRFGISAAAIASSNAVLKLIRLVRIPN